MSEIPYRIRRSSRARRVRVSVDPREGVEVVLPTARPQRDAAEAMRELGPWSSGACAGWPPRGASWAWRDGTGPYLGERLELVREAGRTRVERRDDQLLVPEGDPTPALERWYRRRARAEIAPRLDAAAPPRGTPYAGLSIRGQRTRWAQLLADRRDELQLAAAAGSRAGAGRGGLARGLPPAVPDHSRRFWTLLERHCPGHREPQRWLRRYGGPADAVIAQRAPQRGHRALA